MLVLPDSVITQQFKGLTPAGVLAYQKHLLAALSEYSQDETIIPPRIVTTTPFCTHLFMASTGSRVGMKAITGSKEGFKGITTILDKETGYPLAVINGATLTAFRTALCNTLPLVKYFPVDESYNGDTLVVFGVGDQAVWHVRLTLILYPGRFSQVVIVNRTFSKAVALAEGFKKEYPAVGFVGVTNSTHEGVELLKEHFKNVSVIFTCIPTSIPTVTKELVGCCGSKRLFIGAIGSYKPHMTEIDGAVISRASSMGKIVVDSKDHCLHEAGEFIINGVTESQLVDISTIYSDWDKQQHWMTKSGIVISKLVGLCIMDVWVGDMCLQQALEAGVGTKIDDF